MKVVQYFRCDQCQEKTSVATAYSFNYKIIPFVLFVKDMVRQRQTFAILSLICNGLTFHANDMVCTGTRSLASKKCWDKFLSRWTLWIGFPQIVTTDRELHNRGSFARGLKSGGVHLRHAGTESEQIGRGERHGALR